MSRVPWPILRPILLATLACALLAPARPARATEPAGPAAEVDAARHEDSAAAWQQRGLDLFLAGRLAEARDAFAASTRRLRKPRALAFLLLTTVRLGRCADVPELVRRLDRRELEPVLDAAVTEALGPQGCPLPAGVAWRCDARLRVESEPPGATIATLQRGDEAGQQQRGDTPLEIEGLCPGDLVVTARRWGYREAATALVLEPAATATVRLALDAVPPDLLYDRYRKHGAVGAAFTGLVGRSDDGRWSPGEAFAVGGHVALMLPAELRLTGAALYLRTPDRRPTATDAHHHALVLRGRGELTWPLVRRMPLPGSDARWLAVAAGGGGDVLIGTPRGVHAFVDASVHVLWLTLRGHAGLGSSLGLGKGMPWSAGLEAAVQLYL